MATFTVTTAQNIDALTSKAGGDTYNINGGTLTIDQDSRYGTNQTTSTTLGPITISATLGGTVEIDARAVRLIPYNTGSGNVPALNTTISQGGVSGKLLTVQSAINAAPTATGAAMPASGFIKLKQVSGGAFAAGALTGIGASATGADVVGWLELVGDEASTITANRLGLFRMRGDWYALGTTDGTRATTYQLPTHGGNRYCAGVWVETGTATGVYEFYPAMGSMTATSTNVATDATRGKVCWVTSAGVLRFGHDGTNSTGGYIPPAGRLIRVPNIFCENCTTAARTANALPNATLATRYDFTTTGGGVVSIDKVNLNWYPSFAQAYSVTLTNVGIMSALTISETAAALEWSEVHIGQEGALSAVGLTMSLMFAGGTLTNCSWGRATAVGTGSYVASLTDIDGFDFISNYFRFFQYRNHATTGTVTATRMNNCNFTSCKFGGGRLLIATCVNNNWTNTIYYDHPATTTATTFTHYLWDISSGCTDLTFDGLTFDGLNMVQPYLGILDIAAAGCARIKLRNLGTYASPLSLGGSRADGATWTRSTTTATVTKVAHGLKANDIIYVIISSDVSAIVVGAKTVASAPTADTFTFTCLNAGAASGTVSYYPQVSAYLFVLAGGAAANDVRVQRCYTPYSRSGLFTSDNSNKNILVENVISEYIGAPVLPHLNGRTKGVHATFPYTAQTSVYGTHFLDHYTGPIPPNLSSQSWSRSSTTATLTSTNHTLKTGDLIQVTVSSSTAAIVLGVKTVTAVTKDTVTFTCLNAGSTSGTLTYVPMQSRLAIVMNEATSDTTSQVTFDAGTPGFTSAGGLYMPVINDQVTFEWPHYIKGITSFPINIPTMAGGTITNYNIYYSIDLNDGNGYSAYKNMYYQRTGGGGSSSSTTVTMTSTTGVEAGNYIQGTNIAPNAKVVSVDSATNITVDIANTGTVSGTLIFYNLPNESTIDASLGFKIKIRIITGTTNSSAITSLYVHTNSTETSRAYQYALDTVTLTLTGLISGSDIVVYSAGTTTILDSIDANAGTTWDYVYETVEDVDIGVFMAGYIPFYIRNYSLTSADASLPIAQVVDRAYLT